MGSLNPIHGAGELQALREELTLHEATGRDILTLLKWEKCAHKQVQQSHRLLEQEHLLLQQKYSSVTARAEADSHGTKELLFRLSNVEEELPKFKTDLAQYKEQSRQLRDENSRLRQELQQREAMFEGLSLQLRNAHDANGLLHQALDQAKESLRETAKEVQLLKMQQAVAVNPEEPSKPAMLEPPSTLTPASNSSSQIKRASMAGASPGTIKRTALRSIINFEAHTLRVSPLKSDGPNCSMMHQGFSRAQAKMPSPFSSRGPSPPPAFSPSHRAGVSPSPMLTPGSILSSRVKRASITGASPRTPHRTLLGDMTNTQGFIAAQGKLQGCIPSPAASPSPACPSPPPHRRPLPTMLSGSATPVSGRLFQRQEQHRIKGPSSSCSTRDSNSIMSPVSALKLTKTESSFQLASTPLARTEPAGAASPRSAVLAAAPQSDTPSHCAAGDIDLSGLMLLCAAADTLSPPPSDAVSSVQLDKTAGLMMLCKAALGSPSPMVPVSPRATSDIGSSSMAEDGPTPTPTEHGAKGNASPGSAAPHFDTPRRCAAGDADFSGLMLLCAAADTLSPPPSDAVGPVQLDKTAGLKLLCKAALGSPSPMIPVSPKATSDIGSNSMAEDGPTPTPTEHGAKGIASPGSAAPQSETPCPCAAGDADFSGLMLLCAAADTLSPPPSDAVGSVQLDSAAGLMLLCKAALGSPSPMGPVSPAHVRSSIITGGGPAPTPSERGAKGDVNSSRRISNGSLTSPAAGIRATLSGNQSRRPSWSIAGPHSHAGNSGLTPCSVRGTRPARTASAAPKLAATACLSSPQVAAHTQSSSPSHSAAVTSKEVESSRLMLPCAAAHSIQACCDAAARAGHLNCANPMLLCDLAVSSPSQTLLKSPPDSISSRTGVGAAFTPVNSNGRQDACPASSIADPCSPAAADMSPPHRRRTSPPPAAVVPSTAALGPTYRSAVPSTAGTKGGAVQHDRLRSRPTTRSTAAATGRSITAVAAPAPRMLTRGQAAVAAGQAQVVSASSGAPASSGRKQKRSLKPEAPTRRQPQRVAKPQWR
ncbi:hypothetical protein ABBQ38_005133 [Trebouxia sp. C0009 RCD-2024]